MLTVARKEGYAVRAFEVWNLESIQVVIEAAEYYHRSVILQFGPLEAEYSGIDTLGHLAVEAARNSRGDVAVHLDHGDSCGLVLQAIQLGISKVNICSELVDAFGRGIAETYSDPDRKITVPALFDRGKEYALELVKEKIRLFSMVEN